MDAVSIFGLVRFIFALVALVVGAHFLGRIFQKCKLPKVIGEISAGLVLGPTILGWLYPAGYTFLFTSFPESSTVISLLATVGLIFLMFISGFESNKKINAPDQKIVIGLLLGATSIPLAGGWLIPKIYDITPFLGPANNLSALTAILALAVAVTSIPVIAKIFLDLGMIQTRFARLVLAVATIEDIILWGILAVVTGVVVTGDSSVANIFTHLGITALFFVIALLLMPRVINALNSSKYSSIVNISPGVYLLAICFGFSFLAHRLNVNVVFGALLAGIIVGRTTDARFETVKKQIKDVSLVTLVPLYFAVVGLKLDLIHAFNIPAFLTLLFFAMLLKTTGTLLSAKILKMNWRSSVNFAMALNARGGPGIVLATVAYDLEIINQDLFVILVMIAIVTSLMAGIWFRRESENGRELLTE